MKYELKPYSETYSYAYVKVSSLEEAEMREWCKEHDFGIEQEDVSGWSFIVNLKGKGAAVLFKLRWAGRETEDELRSTAAKKAFLAKFAAMAK